MSTLRLALVALLGAASLSSCLTEEAPEPRPWECPYVTPPEEALLTRWNWQQSSGGIAGGTQTSTSSTQRAIEFGTNGVVRYYTNGQLTDSDTYTLQSGTSMRTGQPALLIQYGHGIRQSYTISGQQLTLWDEAADGFTHKYSY